MVLCLRVWVGVGQPTYVKAFAMHWNKQQVESFFGNVFISTSHIHEMHFGFGDLKYYVRLDEASHLVVLNADPSRPDSAFPAIELQFQCARIEQTEAGGVGPVLLFYASDKKENEALRLCITRTKEHTFSLSPHLKQNSTK